MHGLAKSLRRAPNCADNAIDWLVSHSMKGRDSKSAIVTAARDLLAERGLSGMTFDRIARRAECAKGLVNYHFPSRIVLLTELVSAITDGLWNARIAGLSAPGTAVVEATWNVLLAERASSVHLAMAGLASMRSDERIDQVFRLTDESNMRRWVSETASWMRRSKFRTDSQDDVARAAAALLDGFALRLSSHDPDELYPAYLTAWLGLIAALSASRD